MEMITTIMLYTCYIINCQTGVLNGNWLTVNSFGGLVNQTNSAVGGGEGWLFALIPFLIIGIILSARLNNPAGGFSFAALVAAGITVLETGFITYPSINLQLYTFISIMILTAVAYLFTGVENTYG